MYTGWMKFTEHAQHRGRFLLKVRQQFVNNFDNVQWVPEVWFGPHLLDDGNGRSKTDPEAAMNEACTIAEELSKELNSPKGW